MEVTINQQLFTIIPNSNLLEALLAYGLHHTKGVAVAVNGTVIPKTYWSQLPVRANDSIVIIKAAQGG